METALKIVMVGDSNVGKSQLSLRFCKRKFTSDSQSTVGIEFATRTISLNEYIVKAQVWDTAGQERFESMTKAYFRNAVGAVLVYDIGNRLSFENMKNKWLVQLREFGHEDMFVIIVGNKCDTDSSRRVISIAEAAEFAECTGLDFVETSARTGEHVELAFRRVIVSVAQLLPHIKDYVTSQGLPKGWLYLPEKSKYLNLWTGEAISVRPELEAPTGLIVNGTHQVNAVVFRDSSSGQATNSVKVSHELDVSNSDEKKNKRDSKSCPGSCVIL